MKFDFDKQPGLIRKNHISCDKKPLVSIITPFYNAGRYFEQTFNCVMNQTFIWYEWIIVNDGSTEKDDIKILEELTAADSRIKVFHTANRGPAAARNYAVSKTSTDIIVSLDADDLIEPVYLEQTYWALFFHPDAAWAYTDSLGFQEMQYVWQVPFSDSKLKKRNFLIEVGTFRKKIFEAVGGYDDAQKHSHEDWNLWLRFMTKGGYPVHVSSLSAWYRIVNNGALHKTNDNKEVKKRAYARIKEVVRQINQPVEAVQYPHAGILTAEYMPKCSEWTYLKEKKQREVLVFVSHLDEGEYSNFNHDFIKTLIKQGCHVGLMSTLDSVNGARQSFTADIEDIYELPAFLDIADYSKFVSYYVKSRGVDEVYINNSSYGYYIASWLKRQFADLQILEYCNGSWQSIAFKQVCIPAVLNRYIAIAAEFLDRGGVEQVIALLALELVRRGVPIKILCLQEGGLTASRLTADGIEVLEFHNDRHAFQTYIKKYPPALVNTHFVRRNIRFLHKRGIPVVEVIHNMYIFFGHLTTFLEKRNEAYFTRLVAVSEIVKETYERCIKETDKITVIGNAAQLRERPEKTRDELRALLNIPADAYVLLNVGSIDSRKNQVGIVHAFEHAKMFSKTPMYLVFAGNVLDEAYHKRLLDEIAESRERDDIILLPFRDNIRELYQMADVLVMNSYYEGWSIAATEALYDGLPLILSKCGSANELVCDGRYGCVVSHPLKNWKQMDAAEILKKIEECWSDNTQELADAILKMEQEHVTWREKRMLIAKEAQERFSADAMSDRYLHLFCSLLQS